MTQISIIRCLWKQTHNWPVYIEKRRIRKENGMAKLSFSNLSQFRPSFFASRFQFRLTAAKNGVFQRDRLPSSRRSHPLHQQLIEGYLYRSFFRFILRCGNLFCAAHRYSDKHDCPYDYKNAGRDAIAKANPVVVAEKLNKI
ncbi:hypothetical protein K7X08_007573 [Anisodus acutangulus]|uniref:AN1-type domain-containing protein n=1 Tax=Anisodus acutangulus TaxID=402998 RepID=A0A9Q1LCV8_9SOLA|nr:hypothetical protein K7X08_007573 [Anisodus acutangulus]